MNNKNAEIEVGALSFYDVSLAFVTFITEERNYKIWERANGITYYNVRATSRYINGPVVKYYGVVK